MKYIAVFVLTMVILIFWLIGLGWGAPVQIHRSASGIATIDTPFGTQVIAGVFHSGIMTAYPPGCLPDGQSHAECLEYDNGGKCIHSKLWLECWNPMTNEPERTVQELDSHNILSIGKW